MWNVSIKMFLASSFCNFLSSVLSSYGFTGSLFLLLMLIVLQLVYEFLFAKAPENLLTKSITQLTSFNEYQKYSKELCSFLSNKNIERKTELLIRGYVGQHASLCPCKNECPLGIALRSNRDIVEKIDRTLHVYKSMPLLVAHAERMYEYYIDK